MGVKFESSERRKGDEMSSSGNRKKKKEKKFHTIKRTPSPSQPLPPLGLDRHSIGHGPAVPLHPVSTAFVVGHGGASGPVAVLARVGDAVEVLAGRQVTRQEGRVLIPGRMVRQWRLVGTGRAVHCWDGLFFSGYRSKNVQMATSGTTFGRTFPPCVVQSSRYCIRGFFFSSSLASLAQVRFCANSALFVDFFFDLVR